MTSSYDKDALVNALLGKPKPTQSPFDSLFNPSPAPTPPSPFGSLMGSTDFGSLFDPSPVPPKNALAGLLGMIGQPSPPPANALAGLFSPFASNSLADLVAQPVAPVRPAPTYAPATVKRKGFFSFHYADIIRVNNVRNAWKINAPGREDKRQFFDRSLWESVQRKNPEGLKNLIRTGMAHSSAVCVLVGAETWSRPWVRYEIARSVIDKKGLLAVHSNNLRHHHRLAADVLGDNPLAYMAVGCPNSRGIYFLYERVLGQVVQYGQSTWEWQWEKYSKFSSPVPLPKYMQASPPQVGFLVPLSDVTAIYDYVAEEGHKNIGAWIDTAALRAGR
jgi:hypothetical protein